MLSFYTRKPSPPNRRNLSLFVYLSLQVNLLTPHPNPLPVEGRGGRSVVRVVMERFAGAGGGECLGKRRRRRALPPHSKIPGATDCGCGYAEAVGGGVGGGGGEPEALGGGFGVEALEDAVELGTGSGGGDGEAVAFIIRAGFGADLVPGDGGGGVGGGFIGGLEDAWQ
jgi:hypothetical protein